MHRSTIRVTLGDQAFDLPYGTPVSELLTDHPQPSTQPPLAAIVHNRCVDLSARLTANTDVRVVDYTMREGVLVYRRSASLMLLEAVRQRCGTARVRIGQALGNGYFYTIETAEPFSAEQTEALRETMRQMAADALPLYTERVSLDEAREIFAARGADDKLLLLSTWWEPSVELVHCGETCDIHHSPVAPDASHITTFELCHQPAQNGRPGGVIMRFPPRGKPRPVPPLPSSPKLVAIYRETQDWLEIMNVRTVGQLNKITVRGEAGELIRVAEGLHEKKVAQIADKVCDGQHPARLVLIAGPSSSGKTTFSKRLSLQLRVNGIQPVALSTDNFYVNREDTPLDEDGKYDFESIEAIDLALFNETLSALLRGEEVLTPRFDFNTGKRRDRSRWIPMRLNPEQVLVVEGIHGLNPRLTEAVPAEDKYKIYVSALTQLCIDNHNRIFTSDTRFLRRIIRDRMFRGYSASQTIQTWPSVRRGELRNIFPYQEEADSFFNSALVYEVAVLRLYAERFLLEVSQDDPAYVSAYRLLSFVERFVPIFDESIPQTSLLREFIGGSYFNY
ncbi:MAG: nucleoside kinase [Deltaproteobacteria bacterium]|nr:nucleoside kinase [Deltaproteobacteria bacterium]